MEKEFIPYEQALALKELGFDSNHYILCVDIPDGRECTKVGQYPILYQQAFRWFREKYKELKFFIKEEDFREGLYEYDIKDVLCASGYKTYEEAELECLKKLIEITNGNNN